MKKSGTSRLCQRVIAVEFYRQNNGFFIVIALLLFGLFSAENHRMLADLAVNDLKFFALAYAIPWLLYSWKTLSWGLDGFSSQENRVLLHQLSLIGRFRQWKILIQVKLAMLFPVLMFVALLLRSALLQHLWNSGLLILLLVVFLTIVPVFIWINRLRNPVDVVSGFSLPGISLKFPSFQPAWLLRKLLQETTMQYFLTKLLSMFLIISVCILYGTDDYDFRLIMLGILPAAFSHLGFCDYSLLLEQEFSILRNLPMSAVIRLWRKTLAWVFLLLPDLVLLLRNCPPETGLVFLLQVIVFYISLALALDFLSYWLSSHPEYREKLLPIAFFALAFAIMFSIPPALLSICLWLLIWYLNGFYFYKVESQR